MKQVRIPAVFMRGGTSKGLMIRRQDLPRERAAWDRIFLAGLGSPDPYGRQLDGMGGGISSLSKVCVIGPPTRADADVDYTFAQVLIKEALVDYNALCGNMSSAVGPFAVDEAMVHVAGERATIRIHNTNTRKIILAHFPLDGGLAAVDGDLVIPGVAGTGAPVRLEFVDPAGATTGTLLPTGSAADVVDVPGVGPVRVSMVDASNACVFVRAAELGLAGDELPAEIENNTRAMQALAAIRLAASVTMGVARNLEEAARKTSVPFVGFVSEPKDARMSSGDEIRAGDVDLTARIISNGQPHRALPLGASMCLAVAARISGSVVHEVTRVPGRTDEDIRVAMPSGILRVTAEVRQEGDRWIVERGGFYRTQRRLFEGHLLVRAAAVA
ncbi:MAG: PrpF family protein [Betaproteobacteria bacterium]|nr:PrpF family protein [Betaproteobacteria bacterium]